ncbi:MAG: hypothetical protein CFE21_12055 [Bacteroidetes bacterium B1(2017)]|nr:MAG: hypothetical protein CFE21_12055 [Bacteroidetes bacterium B1(2017)]
MKNILHKFLLLVGTLLCLDNLNAQQKDTTIENNNVLVTKVFKPQLSEAIRIPVNPNPEKPEFVKPVFNYDIPNQQYSVQPTIYTIKPLSVGTMLLPKLKNNYAKIGYGNYNTPLVEFYLNSVRNKQYQAGLFVKHLSAIGDADYNKFSNNLAYGYVKKFLAKGAVGVDAFFYRNSVNLYGSPNDQLKLSKDPSLVYFLYDLKTNYQNYQTDSNGLVYKLDANYYNYTSNGSFNENDVALKARIAKQTSSIPFELVTGLRLNNNSIHSSTSDIWLNYQRIFFDLNPQVFMTGTDFYLKGGFNSTISSDSAGAKFHFFPKAEGGYSIINNKLVVYAGLKGGLNPNTYRSITTENPFVNEFSLLNTIQRVEVYGGLKGELGPQTNFQITASSAAVENLLCFSKDSSSGHQIALYDLNGSAKLTTLSLAIQHQWNEKFRIGIITNVFGYQLKSLAKAYSLPQFETKLNSTYNIGDKFLLKLDLIYWGERTGRVDSKRTDGTFVSTDYKMNPFVDLNFGIDYRYSKNLSAFLNFNNIANNRYQRYYALPVYGINILGGFTFTF